MIIVLESIILATFGFSAELVVPSIDSSTKSCINAMSLKDQIWLAVLLIVYLFTSILNLINYSFIEVLIENIILSAVLILL